MKSFRWWLKIRTPLFQNSKNYGKVKIFAHFTMISSSLEFIHTCVLLTALTKEVKSVEKDLKGLKGAVDMVCRGFPFKVVNITFTLPCLKIPTGWKEQNKICTDQWQRAGEPKSVCQWCTRTNKWYLFSTLISIFSLYDFHLYDSFPPPPQVLRVH